MRITPLLIRIATIAALPVWAKKLGIFFLIFPRSGESIKDKRMRLYDKNMIEMRDGRKPVISPTTEISFKLYRYKFG